MENNIFKIKNSPQKGWPIGGNGQTSKICVGKHLR
jgi:hypothetical protein